MASMPDQFAKDMTDQAEHVGAADRSSERYELRASATSTSDDHVATAAMHLRELPLLDRGPDGEVCGGFAIDYWLYIDENLLLISGWVFGDQYLRLVRDPEASPDLNVRLFPRPDVEEGFPRFRDNCKGVLAVLPRTGATFLFCGTSFWYPPHMSEGGERIWQDHADRLGFLLEHCSRIEKPLPGLASQIASKAKTNPRARGYLEQAKGIPEHGGLVVGWAIALSGIKFALMDWRGNFQILSQAVRWHRPDIVEAFGSQFGTASYNAGFLQAWHYPLSIGQDIRLVAIDGDDCYTLAVLKWDWSPIEPASFAKWAFELPTPLDQFFNRLDRHDGAIIRALIADKLASRKASVTDVVAFGPEISDPKCSIIIPLYSRFDFVMNQLLEFSEDEQLRQLAEIIYVVDDPRISAEFKQQAWLLYESNRIPFKIIDAGENRGYSGANNLGVSASRAPFILLLNSDVIPVEPGWLGKMISAFDEGQQVGIVGARLLYTNGSIQHDGMSFVWHPELSAHVNKHPGMGFEPPIARPEPSARTAVTGACLMIRGSSYLDLGGLDETFLIGDFEDSDLCLKVLAAGKTILCVEDVHLVHLERQSLSNVGQSNYRALVVRYNAWQHEKRWGKVLRSLAEGASA